MVVVDGRRGRAGTRPSRLRLCMVCSTTGAEAVAATGCHLVKSNILWPKSRSGSLNTVLCTILVCCWLFPPLFDTVDRGSRLDFTEASPVLAWCSPLSISTLPRSALRSHTGAHPSQTNGIMLQQYHSTATGSRASRIACLGRAAAPHRGRSIHCAASTQQHDQSSSEASPIDNIDALLGSAEGEAQRRSGQRTQLCSSPPALLSHQQLIYSWPSAPFDLLPQIHSSTLTSSWCPGGS